MADDLDVLLGGEKHSREYHAQYRGHQNHAHGHEFDLQFSDHGRIAPFLSKTLWKSGKNVDFVENYASSGASRQ